MKYAHRIKKLEDKAKPQGQAHLVWQESGETEEQAIARYREAHKGPIGSHDDFCVIRWARSQEEADAIY